MGAAVVPVGTKIGQDKCQQYDAPTVLQGEEAVLVHQPIKENHYRPVDKTHQKQSTSHARGLQGVVFFIQLFLFPVVDVQLCSDQHQHEGNEDNVEDFRHGNRL